MGRLRIAERSLQPLAFTKPCGDRSLQQFARASGCEDSGDCACRQTHPIRVAHFRQYREERPQATESEREQLRASSLGGLNVPRIASVSVCSARVPLDQTTSFATRTRKVRDYCLVKV